MLTRRRSSIVFLGFIPGLTLIALILFAVNYFQYRPSVEEAIDNFLKLEGQALPTPAVNSYIRQVKVTQVISEVPATQLVVGTYLQDERTWATGTSRCIFASYVTRHWLTGPRAYSAVGGNCRLIEGQGPPGPPLLMFVGAERGTYLVIGDSIDERVVEVQAHWLDGLVTTAPLVEGTFLFFRAEGVEVAWVAGIDGQGRVLSDTLVYNDQVHFSPLNYTAVRQVTLGDGVFVIGAYSFTIPRQECVEVTYLTAENAGRFLQGKESFVGQRGCIKNPGEHNAVGPAVSTRVEDDMVISGRPLHSAIVQVRIHWSDGVEQTVLVEDAFYFARRPNTSSTVQSITGLDAAGNIIFP